MFHYKNWIQFRYSTLEISYVKMTDSNPELNDDEDDEVEDQTTNGKQRKLIWRFILSIFQHLHKVRWRQVKLILIVQRD